MSRTKSTKVDLSDHYRALRSDTLTDDAPIVFSNDGLHRWSRSRYLHKDVDQSSKRQWPPLARLLHGMLRNKYPTTIPYTFAISASSKKERQISLVHPRNQLIWCEFYSEFGELITHYCQRSGASLRAPKKIASKTFVPNPQEDDHIHRLLATGVEESATETRYRHPTSYFSYSGHSRYYKFFDTERFMRLEKRYPSFWILDVSRCFQSIYTHSIAWATKSKEHVKRYVTGSDRTFGGKFDKVMRDANWGETNGIVIGPEISRIFAEVILQDVDIDVENALRERPGEHQLLVHRDYVFHRYIDDYFVFAASDEVASQVAQVLAQELERRNLFLNDGKTQKFRRPFITGKSIAVESARGLLDELTSIIYDGELEVTVPATEDRPERKKKVRKLAALRRTRQLKANFVRKLRITASSTADGYAPVSGFVIHGLVNLVVEVCTSARLVDDGDTYERASRTVALLLDLMYFAYSVEPTVTKSLQVATASVLAIRLFNQDRCPDEAAEVQQVVYDGCVAFAQATGRKAPPGPGQTSIELLNLVTILGELDEDHQIPWEILRDWLTNGRPTLSDAGYFGMMAGLHYIRDRQGYDAARAEMTETISDLLEAYEPHAAQEQSGYCHLLLDSLCCPYIDRDARAAMFNAALVKIGAGGAMSKARTLSMLQWMEKRPFFIDWANLSIERCLERKRGTRVY